MDPEDYSKRRHCTRPGETASPERVPELLVHLTRDRNPHHLPWGASSWVLEGTKRTYKPRNHRRPQGAQPFRASLARSPSWPLRTRETDGFLRSFCPPVTVPRRPSSSGHSNQWHSHHQAAAAFTNEPPQPRRRPEPYLLDRPRPALLWWLLGSVVPTAPVSLRAGTECTHKLQLPATPPYTLLGDALCALFCGGHWSTAPLFRGVSPGNLDTCSNRRLGHRCREHGNSNLT